MIRVEFMRLVAEAIELIPARFRREMKNLALVVEDAPNPKVLREMDIEAPDSLYGLYQGTPLTERTWDFGNQLPDRITLYREAILRRCTTDKQVVREIRATLLHELGHYFGLPDSELG